MNNNKYTIMKYMRIIMGVSLVLGGQVMRAQVVPPEGCDDFANQFAGPTFDGYKKVPAACSSLAAIYTDSVTVASPIVDLIIKNAKTQVGMCKLTTPADFGVWIEGVVSNYKKSEVPNLVNTLKGKKSLLTADNGMRANDLIANLASVLFDTKVLWQSKANKVLWCMQKISMGEYGCSIAQCMLSPTIGKIQVNTSGFATRAVHPTQPKEDPNAVPAPTQDSLAMGMETMAVLAANPALSTNSLVKN